MSDNPHLCARRGYSIVNIKKRQYKQWPGNTRPVIDYDACERISDHEGKTCSVTHVDTQVFRFYHELRPDNAWSEHVHNVILAQARNVLEIATQPLLIRVYRQVASYLCNRSSCSDDNDGPEPALLIHRAPRLTAARV
jgi:hypothetical protein